MQDKSDSHNEGLRAEHVRVMQLLRAEIQDQKDEVELARTERAQA